MGAFGERGELKFGECRCGETGGDAAAAVVDTEGPSGLVKVEPPESSTSCS